MNKFKLGVMDHKGWYRCFNVDPNYLTDEFVEELKDKLAAKYRASLSADLLIVEYEVQPGVNAHKYFKIKDKAEAIKFLNDKNKKEDSDEQI
jgi:hypothetical protein